MKKVTATITTENGEVKAVKVKLDEKIAVALEQSGNPALIEAYVADEYNTRNNERKETRRHISLESLVENGQDFAEEEKTPLDFMLRREQRAIIKQALQTITKRQRFIVLHHVLENQSFREIGDLLGIHKETVREQFAAAVKKLQKFFEEHPVKR